jgi:hypothetical protein
MFSYDFKTQLSCFQTINIFVVSKQHKLSWWYFLTVLHILSPSIDYKFP